MRAFRHYFKPSEGELRTLWADGIFSFDASVLLNIYGYSRETREKLVDFIEKNAERVRLAYQFGLEYSRDRSVVIIKQVNNYHKVEKALQSIRDVEIAPKRDHPFLSKKSVKAYEQIQRELEQSRKAMEGLIGSDPYAERIVAALDGRVGPCPTAEELQQRHAEAKERYDRVVPPGYKDLGEKDVPDAYGDYIGWHQLMQIASQEGKGVILAIDDFKDDWWLIERERTVGPRPELLEEFARVTRQSFYMYTSENFLRAAKEFLEVEIRDEVIEEVSMRLESQRETQRAVGFKAVPPEASTAEAEKSVGPADQKSVSLKTGAKPRPTQGDLESEPKKSGPAAE